MITPARVILALTGLIIGAFAVAFVQLGFIGAVLFLAIPLSVIFVLKLFGQGDNLWLLGGLAIGAVLVLIAPELSPATLGDVGLMLALGLVILIIGMAWQPGEKKG